MHATRHAVAATLLLTLAPAVVGLQANPTDGATGLDDTNEPRRYVVGFHDLPDERDTYQGEPVVDASETLSFLVVETDEPAGFLEDARRDADVRYVEEDERDIELQFTPDDPRYDDQYGPQITNTESAWDTTLGSTAVTVGLLDTGINPDHEDFVADRVEGHDYFNGDSEPDDEAGLCGYHGSHTSGTAAATTNNGVGIAGMSESSIDMHKIFDGSLLACLAASDSDVADALADLGDEGAHISSNSWGGGGDDQVILDAIDHAHSKGVIHVAAAGNSGECEDCVSEPWKSRPEKVVIVSCTNDKDKFCSFSSQGPEVDLAAPGEDVLSVDGDGAGYDEKSGTSMSTPHVSGAVALYIDANGDVPHSTMEDELAASADDVGLSEERQGHGRLDAGGLVN